MSKKLVAYFSASGTTARVAKALANAAGAVLYEIKPAVPYSKAYLNWMDKQSRSSLEMRDKSSRPALADKDANIVDYDTIFVGFPIWWYIAPTIINSFLEAYDFSGKKSFYLRPPAVLALARLSNPCSPALRERSSLKARSSTADRTKQS